MGSRDPSRVSTHDVQRESCRARSKTHARTLNVDFLFIIIISWVSAHVKPHVNCSPRARTTTIRDPVHALRVLHAARIDTLYTDRPHHARYASDVPSRVVELFLYVEIRCASFAIVTTVRVSTVVTSTRTSNFRTSNFKDFKFQLC